MPTISVPAAHRGFCSSCRKQGLHFQRCSGCRVAEYCSKQCQKADWKHHQPFCRDRKSALQGVADHRVGADALLLSRWFDHWHRALFCWAAFLANVANQPRDYLESHCFLLCVRRRTDVAPNSSVASIFEASQVGMFPDNHIANLVRMVGGEEYDAVDLLASDAPAPDMLRAVVVYREAFMSSKLTLTDLFPHNSHILLTDPSSPCASLASAAFHSHFLTQFGPAVKNGDVVSCFHVVAKKLQEIEERGLVAPISV
ncbi:hypothetical protein B0H11DRAFT_2022937 [Mycena galericulata]|nr:hypothetical protein B0H11DRAFT_2022937 [Mycena galericulata]